MSLADLELSSLDGPPQKETAVLQTQEAHLGPGPAFSCKPPHHTNDILNSLSGSEVIFNADPPNMTLFIRAPEGKHLKGRDKQNTKINAVTGV